MHQKRYFYIFFSHITHQLSHAWQTTLQTLSIPKAQYLSWKRSHVHNENISGNMNAMRHKTRLTVISQWHVSPPISDVNHRSEISERMCKMSDDYLRAKDNTILPRLEASLSHWGSIEIVTPLRQNDNHRRTVITFKPYRFRNITMKLVKHLILTLYVRGR